MTFSAFCFLFGVGSGGAISLELLKLYEYHGTMSAKKLRALVRSGLYWGVVAGMVFASGFIAWAYYANATHGDATAWRVAIAGMAARSIVREVLAGRVAHARVTEGDTEIDLRDIFLPGSASDSEP